MILKRVFMWVMPQYWLLHKTAYKRWLSTIILAVGLGDVSYSVFQKMWSALTIVILIIILGSYLYSIHKTTHEELLKKLALQRHDLNVRDFASEFDARLTNTWVVRTVYEAFSAYFKKMYPILNDFSVKADDELTLLFEHLRDFESEILKVVAERINIQTVDEEGSQVDVTLMTTVRDLVSFLNLQLRLQRGTVYLNEKYVMKPNIS